MARSRLSTFILQTWTLTKKILIIAVLRHWFSTLFRSLILPIPYLVLLLNIQHFLGFDSTYGIGSPQPVNSLLASTPDSKTFAIVQPPGLGPDVDQVVSTLTAPLRQTKQLAFLNNVNDLLTTCRQDLRGTTDCFAAVVFNDSPLTPGNNGIWNYTIRADSYQDGRTFDAQSHNNDEDRIYLPLQVALENAITNSTLIPDEYMFTSLSQETGDEQVREQYQQLVIRDYGVAFFITLVSVVYHLVSMITSERESGMTQLIDAMGGSAAARICSYVLAFDIIYLPSWTLFGICKYFLFFVNEEGKLIDVVYWDELFTTSSAAISIFWQIFTGMTVTSTSVFAAMFFNRAQISGVFSVFSFLLLGLGAEIIHNQKLVSVTVGLLSCLFPSMNFVFMLGYMCRYEGQGLATDLLKAPPSTTHVPSSSRIPGIALWMFLVLQIIAYPLLAYLVEKWIHETKYKNRTVSPGTDTETSPTGVEIIGLTKIYPPTLRQKWFSRAKKTTTVAVDNLNLAVRRGQLLCLLGANGSGKTTTLDMIGGLQNPPVAPYASIKRFLI